VDTFTEFVKDFLIPGSAWFFVIAATGCAALLYGRTRRAAVGRALLVALVAMYWAISMPPVARGLQVVAGVRPAKPPSERPQRDQDLPIVVLGNGTMAWTGNGAVIDVLLPQTGMNAIRAIERYHQSPDSMLIASGGAAEDGTPEAVLIRDALLKNGVPTERIVLEAASRNTHQQAVEVARMLKVQGVHACLLVTSAQHMARAVDSFRSQGIEAIPLAAESQLFSPLWASSGQAHWWLWMIPSSEARAVSRDVMYELFASIYYRARGWA